MNKTRSHCARSRQLKRGFKSFRIPKSRQALYSRTQAYGSLLESSCAITKNSFYKRMRLVTSENVFELQNSRLGP